jgi:hypothetical protein
VPPGPLDELPHAGAADEEWLFTCWTDGGAAGLVSGYRIRRPARPAWYWAALVRRGQPLLHVTEWEVPARGDALLVKAPGLWAEHTIDVPMVQWTVANETYAAALDDPAEAMGRAYGVPTAVAFDLEWYAVAEPVDVEGGYRQDGVVHGLVELADAPMHLAEIPARRWHRWGQALGPVTMEEAFAHTGLRAPFAFPDGTVADWVLTPDGWRELGVARR